MMSNAKIIIHEECKIQTGGSEAIAVLSSRQRANFILQVLDPRNLLLMHGSGKMLLEILQVCQLVH